MSWWYSSLIDWIGQASIHLLFDILDGRPETITCLPISKRNMKGLLPYLLLRLPSTIRAAPTVSVLNGTYEGLYLHEFQQDVFLGIPYAQETGGPNRFRVPQSLNDTWDGTRPAKQYGHACPDENMSSDGMFGISEDCLSINIVRPAGMNDSSKLPTMLWIHGGRYVKLGALARPGSGDQATTDLNVPPPSTATRSGQPAYPPTI